MTGKIGDTLKTMKEKSAVRYYARLVFRLLLSIENIWKTTSKPGEKRQFRRAGKKAIDLFMYLAKTWWSFYGSVPDLADWMSEHAPTSDEEIKNGLQKLKNASLPNLLRYRLAKDLMFIRQQVSQGWSENGKL